jgi:hypothetical protein
VPGRVPVHRRPHGATLWRPEVRPAAVLTFPAQEGTTRRPAHKSVVRRRRAQGHGLFRGYEPSWATSCATRLASGLAQSAPWCVATVVLAHAQPRHARSARPSGVQRRSTRRGGGATIVPCATIHGSTAGSHTRSSHGDDGAQGLEWPRSSFQSRCGSSAVRTLAHRQGIHGNPSRRCRSITGKRPRGRKGKDGRGGAHDGLAV